MQYYAKVCKVHTILAAHTVTFPALDFELFDVFCGKIWPEYELSAYDIFRKANNGLPLCRPHFVIALLHKAD